MKRTFLLLLICCGASTMALAQWHHFGDAPQPSASAVAPPGTTNSTPAVTAESPSSNGMIVPGVSPKDAPAADSSAAPATSANNAPPAVANGAPPASGGDIPPNTPNSAPAASAAPDNTPVAAPDAQGAREMPLDSEAFGARVNRRLNDFDQRHQQRSRVMNSYEQASSSDPSLARFADPRKVQVELNDELDREQTSEELAGDYSEQAHDVQVKSAALENFIARRRQSLEALNKKNDATHRQDLEVAMANLARQPMSPETLAEMREIDRRLSEADRNEKDLPQQLSQTKEEATDAAEELAKLQALQVSYQKEAQAFNADALSARHNRMRLASRLEYYVVRSQAEDELDQGHKGLEAARHLSASPEVENLLNGSGAASKSDADMQQLRDCIQKSGDVQGCRAKMHQE